MLAEDLYRIPCLADDSVNTHETSDVKGNEETKNIVEAGTNEKTDTREELNDITTCEMNDIVRILAIVPVHATAIF